MRQATESCAVLTIITEAAIEAVLLRDLDRLGARGYTVTDARGRGSRGVRDAAWDEAANIRIEVICPRATADVLLAHLVAHYFDDYAMVAFVQDVEVLRGNKF